MQSHYDLLLSNAMPVDILLTMFQFLDLGSVASVSEVNKHFLLLTNNYNIFWQKRFDMHGFKIPNKQIDNWYVEFKKEYVSLKAKHRLDSHLMTLLSAIKEERVDDIVNSDLCVNIILYHDIIFEWVLIKKHNQALMNAIWEIVERDYKENSAYEKLFPLLNWSLICNQRIEIISGLMRDVNQEDTEGFNAFERALENGNVDVIKLFFDNGYYDIDLEKDEIKFTPLMIVAKNGNLKAAEYLLGKGAPIDQTDQDGKSALFYAIENNHFDMVKYLIEQGKANYLHKSRLQNMPIESAVRKGVRLDIFQYLLDLLIRNNKPDILKNTNIFGESLFYTASQYGRLDIIEVLVDQIKLPFNVNESNDLKRTLLHTASRNGNIYVMSYLINKGADINAIDKQSNTALDLAIKSGDLDGVKLLFGMKAKYNPKDSLLDACIKGHLEIVKFLKEQGVDFNAPGYPSFVLVAANNYHMELLQYLVEDVHMEIKEKYKLLEFIHEKIFRVFLVSMEERDNEFDCMTYLVKAYFKDVYNQLLGSHNTLCQIALTSHDWDLAKMILLDEKTDQDFLETAIKKNDYQMADFLLKNHFCKEEHIISGLSDACADGKLDFVKILFAHLPGSKKIINACLLTAVENTHIHVAVYLIECEMEKGKFNNLGMGKVVQFFSDKSDKKIPLSKERILLAAKALIAVLKEEESSTILKKYKIELNVGKLGEVYKIVKPLIKAPAPKEEENDNENTGENTKRPKKLG